jgi:hypothetical protein
MTLTRYHELARAHDELARELRDDLRPNWHVYVGKVAIPARLNSAGFSWLYAGLNALAFTIRRRLHLLRGAWRELGIALIVGAMFGVSAFVAQVLSVQLAVEQHQNDLLWRDARTLKYAPRLAEISDQIQAVREAMKAELDPGSSAAKSTSAGAAGSGDAARPEKPNEPPEGTPAGGLIRPAPLIRAECQRRPRVRVQACLNQIPLQPRLFRASPWQ